MCSISGSFNTEKLKELVELNSYRGSYSHSIAYFDVRLNKFSFLEKKYGPADLSTINIPEGHYGICHVQAPTTQSQADTSIHPAILNGSFLWHNGILKPSTISELQIINKSNAIWDTELLLAQIDRSYDLNWIDGSFSCLYWDNTGGVMYHFRNEISPMFVDEDLNFSSTKFEGSNETEPNTWLLIEMVDKQLVPERKFTTACNPYYFED